MSDIHQQRKDAESFVQEHLGELCEEIREWQDTAVLRDDKMRELALLCSYAAHDALLVAEYLVTSAAIRHLATRKPA